MAITADRNVVQKEAENKLKYKSLGIEITTNLEPEMYDTCNICGHWNSKEKLQKKFGSCTRKTFDRFTTKDSYAWNITHNTKVLQCETGSLSGGNHRWLKVPGREAR